MGEFGNPLIKVGTKDEERKQAVLDFWTKMAPIVVKTVEESFLTSEMRNPTHHEVKRRTEITKALAEEMRDLKWSKARIKDTLPRALRLRLTGLVVDLEAMGERSSWVGPAT